MIVALEAFISGKEITIPDQHRSSASMAGLEDSAALISTLFFTFLFVGSLLLKRSSKSEDERKTNLPPGPSKLPIIGNFHQLGNLPHRSLRDLSKKHGPLMFLQLGSIPTIVVSSAEMAEEIMKNHDLDFAGRPALTPPKMLLYGCRDIVFAPYGENWRQAKKICVLEMLSNKRVQSFRLVRDEEVSNMIRNIHDSKGSVINLTNMLISLTNDIVCRAALGKKYFGEGGQYNSNFSELLLEFVKLMGGFNFRDFFPFMGWMDIVNGTDWCQRKIFRRWDAFLDQVIQDHLDPSRDQTEYKDFVDVLLHVQKHSTLDIPFTMDTIKALVLDMIGAGTETTSTTLEWTMAELIRHPEVVKKAQEEIRQVVGSKSKVEEDDLQKMVYLKSIVKESLRLHPPVVMLVPRESIRTTKIQGYTIPAKSMIQINTWAIGRDPTSWARAEEFLPERFINSDIDFKGHDFMFIPFGAGRRGCPGISFSNPVMELALANLLHQFNWELPNGKKGQDLNMAETFGITSHMKSTLLLVASPR